MIACGDDNGLAEMAVRIIDLGLTSTLVYNALQQAQFGAYCRRSYDASRTDAFRTYASRAY